MRQIFLDVGPELDPTQLARAIRCAHRAAIEAQESFTLTARRQYRRYRQAAGTEFMAWPEWHEHYLEHYRAFRARFPDSDIGGVGGDG